MAVGPGSRGAVALTAVRASADAVPAEVAPTLRDACERWPERTAITFAGRLTYRELWQRTAALVAGYRRMGVRRGDRILCQLRNSPEYIVALYAAWEVGAIHAGVDSDLTGPELGRLASSFEPAVVLVEPPPDRPDDLSAVAHLRRSGVRPHIAVRTAGETGWLPDGVESLAALVTGDGTRSGGDGGGRLPGVDETALLLMTSGTTGRPKAFMENLPALMAKVRFFAEHVAPSPDDVHVGYLPLAHAFGLKLALMALHTGGRLVLMERFSPDPLLATIADEGVTILPGTPTTFAIMLQRPDRSLPAKGSVRWAVSAAAPLSPRLAGEVLDRLVDRVFSVYGCSEGFLVVSTDTGVIVRGSVGHTVFQGPAGTAPDGRLRILAQEAERALPHGEVGEVAFGTTRPVRYWDDPPVATDGWYRSGDLGRLDDQGNLHVVGRIKEVVNRGGLKVGPWEVEQAVCAHPAVVDCGVVPLPHPVLGEATCACVVMRDGASVSLADLRAFLSPMLARHKLPDELCALPSLPRSKTGKLDRRALVGSVLQLHEGAARRQASSTGEGERAPVG